MAPAMMSPDELGRVAYAAYGAVTDHKNFRGEPMPTWDNLPTLIRQAWASAGVAVSEAMFFASRKPPARPGNTPENAQCSGCGYRYSPDRTQSRCPTCQKSYDGE